MAEVPSHAQDSAPVPVAPLSDIFNHLRELGPADRRNHRLVTLLCNRDPIAVTRLLGEATAKNRETPALVSSLARAVSILGPPRCCELLHDMWQGADLPRKMFAAPVRRFLSGHLVSTWYSIPLVMHSLPSLRHLNVPRVQVLSWLAKLGLMVPDEAEFGDHAQRLSRQVAARDHRFQRKPEFAGALQRSSEVARSWGYSDEDAAIAQETALAHQGLDDLSQEAQLLALVEELLHLRFNPDLNPRDVLGALPLGQELLASGVDPRRIVHGGGR